MLEVGKPIVTDNCGNDIPMYDLERTICDLVRSRSNIEMQDFSSALKAYISKKNKDLNLLMEYAALFRIQNVMRRCVAIMRLTPEQIKGRIRNVARQNNSDARTLMRIYMMERFLERVAQSEYKDNFIIKGGMLVTSLVGVALRSTMDIDTSIKSQNLSADDAEKIYICSKY